MRAWQTVETTEVDGVPMVVADDDGAFVAAGLTFRVGWADEPIRRRGITHLVEHLAHADLPSRAIEFNASVGPLETDFWARGRPAEVVAHLTAILEGLARPDVTQLPRELGVLRAEGGMGPAPLVDRRFANRGLGGRAWNQFALESEDPELVRSWTAERFHRGALVAWATGPTPGLDLSTLKPGDRPGWPEVERAPGWGSRRHFVWERPAVGWSGEVAVGWAGTAAVGLLAERATARLRHELGTTYSVEQASLATGPDSRVRLLEADRGEGTSAIVVRDALLRDLDELAERGPTREELDAFREVTLRATEERDVAGWLATMGATAILEGRTARDAEGVRAEWQDLDIGDVRDAAAQLRSSLLLAVPSEARPEETEFRSIERPSDVPVSGVEYRCGRRRQGKLLDPTTEVATLLIAPGEGISATRGGYTTTIPFPGVTMAIVVDELEVHVYDASDRCISACVHDAADREAWLGPIESAVGPGRVVRLRRGRDAALDQIRRIATEQLGSRVRVNGLAYIASLELEPFEAVVGVAAGRHEGSEGLLLLTPERLLFRTSADSWWLDLHGVTSAIGSEGVRGGRLELTFPKGRVVLDRVRAKGRATAIAEHVRSVGEGRGTAAAAGEPVRRD